MNFKKEALDQSLHFVAIATNIGNIRVSSIVNGMMAIWVSSALIKVVREPTLGGFLNEMVGITGLTVIVVGLLKFPKLMCFLMVIFSVINAFQV